MTWANGLSKLPWFLMGCGTAIGLGTAGLIWYQNLSREEQKEADEAAGRLAMELFNKQYAQLQRHEANKIHAILERHYAN
jgi:hypothetical protein